MKLFLDFLPIIVFFVAFKVWGIYAATAAATAAAVLLLLGFWFVGRRIEYTLWLSTAVIVLLGGATLILHNEWFIKWKPTVLYWLFAGILVGGRLVFNKDFIRLLLEEKMSLPDSAWGTLLWSWVGFFLLAGVLNIFVAYTYPTSAWVNFKLFGLLGLTFLFVIGQSVWIARVAVGSDAPKT